MLPSPFKNPGSFQTPLTETSNQPIVFQPILIHSKEFKNRLVLSPMCMYSAHEGMANDFHLAHYVSYALRGIGLIMMEATAVESIGRISPRCLGIWSDTHVSPLKRIVEVIHTTSNALIGIQLSHAGRKGSTYPPWLSSDPGKRVPVHGDDEAGKNYRGFQVFAPTRMPWTASKEVYENDDFAEHGDVFEMTETQVDECIQNFIDAARRAKEAGYDLIGILWFDSLGFDVVEVHAAHGYLLHQFLSPLTNKRKDKYGGASLVSRSQILIDILKGIRRVFDGPVFVRFSFTDYLDGNDTPTLIHPLDHPGFMTKTSWDMEQTLSLVSYLYENHLVDLVDCSSGGLVPFQNLPEMKEGYQVGFSALLKRFLPNVKTSCVGLIRRSEHIESILKQGDADLVCIAREFLRNPNFVAQVAGELNVADSIPWMTQYERAKGSFIDGRYTGQKSTMERKQGESNSATFSTNK